MKTVFSFCLFLLVWACHNPVMAQVSSGTPVKLKHAEPLSVDLIRDLGARKGEKEFNLGLSTGAYTSHNQNSGFIEYEFAPLNRLGVEVEIPFLLTAREISETTIPIRGMKMAMQYTFYVNEPLYTSSAIGYIHELKFSSAGVMSSFHPLFIAAKRWGSSFHTMAYVSPVLGYGEQKSLACSALEINTSMHYMKNDGKGFAGIEFNQQIEEGEYKVMMRPQVKAKLSPALSIGLCAGFPLTANVGGPDMLIRIIYEP